MTALEDIPFLVDNPVFQYLADVADISALSQGDRQRYDESIKTMRDHISAYETAINKGLAKGRLEGKAEGRAEERITMAHSMKIEGLSIELIAKITGLSPEEILIL